jgi:hypothetical protein
MRQEELSVCVCGGGGVAESILLTENVI